MHVEIRQPAFVVWTLPLQSRLFAIRCGRPRRAAYMARDEYNVLVRGKAQTVRLAIAQAKRISDV